MKNKIKNKIAALVMCAVVGIGTTFAETPFAGGTGTYNDPFLIETPTQLDNVRNHLDAHFALTNDLDMTGIEFRPIGRNDEGTGFVVFTGSLDGREHIIYNLTIVDSATSVGLFSRIQIAAEDSGQIVIQNLGLVNVSIYNRMAVGAGTHTGAFVGSLVRGTMINIFADDAEIISTIGITGGIVALMQTSRLSLGWFNGSVIASGGTVGGLAGSIGRIAAAYPGSIIENSYVMGHVEGTQNVGGVAGMVSQVSVVRNVWTSATVRGTLTATATNVGGIASNTTVYSRIETSVSLAPSVRFGGLNVFRIANVSANSTLANNFALSTTELWTSGGEGLADTLLPVARIGMDSVNGHSITMEQAQTQATFTTAPFAWDFENIWRMNQGGARLPIFIWQEGDEGEDNGGGPEPPPSSINPDLPTSIAVSVSPNPTFGEVSIEIENAEIKQVLIFTMTGQQVFSTTQSEFNIEHLSRGIYVVHIVTDVGNFVSRIVRR